jgi:Set1/Ash2 histone methyltransferase complex subunit ASH2
MKSKKSIYVHVEKRTKRKLMPNTSTEEKQKAKNEVNIYKLGPTGYPSDHPFNKEGYRYILAEPDPFAPHRKEFDECEDWAGKPIPGWLYRQFSPLCVLVAMHDRAPQLKVAEDRKTVTGEKGYCMVRGSHAVHYGSWYYEVDIVSMPEGAATRLGTLT